MTGLVPLLLLPCWLAFGQAGQAQPPNSFAIGGTTSSFNDSRQDYDPVDGVQVTVMRSTVIASPVSNADGVYSCRVPAGRPVMILFTHNSVESDLVPQLKDLAGKDQLVQRLHVTLLSRDQHIQTYGRESLIQELELILNRLRKIDGEPAGKLRRQIEEFLRKSRG